MGRLAGIVLALVTTAVLRATVAAAADADSCGPDVLERGRLMFNQCAMCHSSKGGDPAKVGPNLFGVEGRRAGTVADFVFSRAMRESGLVWSSETLNKFLANPQAFVPGTQMGYAGMRQPQDRAAVICFLGSSIMWAPP
jgi:cytochrome c